MYSQRAIICNQTGLHARPAAQFVQMAKKFTANVTIENVTTGSAAVSAKSIMRILTLACVKGVEVAVTADGPDEQEAVHALIGLIESGFGE